MQICACLIVKLSNLQLVYYIIREKLFCMSNESPTDEDIIRDLIEFLFVIFYQICLDLIEL